MKHAPRDRLGNDEEQHNVNPEQAAKTPRWRVHKDAVTKEEKSAPGGFIGTRQDLDDALRLAADGRVKPHVETHALDRTPELLERLHRGELLGRAVIVF